MDKTKSDINDVVSLVALAFPTSSSKDFVLSQLTTYKLGGPASIMVTLTSLKDLYTLREITMKHHVDLLMIGKGSNLLVSDSGFLGVVVTFSGDFSELTIENNFVTAGPGVLLPQLARKSAAAGLAGLEWAVGVPGSVGGAVRMNAGGHGSQTKENLKSAHVVDLRGERDGHLTPAELEMGYRSSNIGPSEIVASATFELSYGNREESEKTIREIVSWRREHQPGGRNSGSVFANPQGQSAGSLIDKAGLRGFSIGGADVSTKHANFIQSEAGGSSMDVYKVITHVKQVVYEKFGIDLRPEVRLIGFDKEVMDD